MTNIHVNAGVYDLFTYHVIRKINYIGDYSLITSPNFEISRNNACEDYIPRQRNNACETMTSTQNKISAVITSKTH